MNDRKRRIDEFLKFIRDISLLTPEDEFNLNVIYYYLTELGVPEDEEHKRIDHHFDTWIEHFENDYNSRVFVAPNWRYFCQFISNDNSAAYSSEHLKIYVPLDSAHIERGAKEIFEFLSKAGISHLSKIGSQVRFDDVVIRLVDPEAVPLLMDFLNNNKYIQEGLMPANPFTFNINGIPMAVDGSLSFNSTIASMVLFYINDKKSKKTLETVSVDDFYKFVENYYNYVFSSPEGLAKLEEDFPYEDRRFETIEAQFVNYKNVFELILKSIKNDFTFDDYINHYRECSNIRLQRQKENQLRAIKEKVQDNDIVEKTNKMLLQVIDGMNEKYGNQYGVLSHIWNYLITGDETYITRYKNLRNMVVNSTFREDLRNILDNKQMDFMDYVEQLLSLRKLQAISQKTDEKTARSTIEKQVILTIEEILEIMTNKYGERTAHANLERYLRTGEVNMLTRDYNLRERVVNSTFRMDLKQVLAQRGLKLDYYLATIADTKIVQGEVFLEQAILETYSKYEKKYLAGAYECSGKDFVIASLNQLILYGDYCGFTRDNNARQNLMNNVCLSEVIAIIKKEFGLENDNSITPYELSELAEQYISRVLDNNPKRKL